MLTIGSLFSGIGGLELGLEMAGLGPTLWQVEREEFCRNVLEKHWPHAARFDDVRTIGGSTLAPVDLICGGFPCQDVSSAGKGKGLAGERSGLWREFARVVGEIHPEWVVVENVASGAQRWVDSVVSELEQLSYACLPLPLSANDVGAPHLRRRVFIVAHAHGDREHARAVHAEVAGAPALAPDANCDAIRLDEQWETSGRTARGVRDEGHPLARFPSWAAGGGAEPDMVRMVHGLPRGLDGRRRSALGNSVVPQCAEVVGWVIRELESQLT